MAGKKDSFLPCSPRSVESSHYRKTPKDLLHVTVPVDLTRLQLQVHHVSHVLKLLAIVFRLGQKLISLN